MRLWLAVWTAIGLQVATPASAQVGFGIGGNINTHRSESVPGIDPGITYHVNGRAIGGWNRGQGTLPKVYNIGSIVGDDGLFDKKIVSDARWTTRKDIRIRNANKMEREDGQWYFEQSLDDVDPGVFPIRVGGKIKDARISDTRVFGVKVPFTERKVGEWFMVPIKFMVLDIYDKPEKNGKNGKGEGKSGNGGDGESDILPYFLRPDGTLNEYAIIRSLIMEGSGFSPLLPDWRTRDLYDHEQRAYIPDTPAASGEQVFEPPSEGIAVPQGGGAPIPLPGGGRVLIVPSGGQPQPPPDQSQGVASPASLPGEARQEQAIDGMSQAQAGGRAQTQQPATPVSAPPPMGVAPPSSPDPIPASLPPFSMQAPKDENTLNLPGKHWVAIRWGKDGKELGKEEYLQVEDTKTFPSRQGADCFVVYWLNSSRKWVQIRSNNEWAPYPVLPGGIKVDVVLPQQSR